MPVLDPSQLIDPSPLIDMLVRVIETLLNHSVKGFDWLIEYYFLWTGNFHGGEDCLAHIGKSGCAFTANNVVRDMYRLTAGIADTLVVTIVTFSFVRSMFERSFKARYTLKALLPRLLLVVLMVNFGLAMMQQAIDLNNGVVHAIWAFDPNVKVTASSLWGQLIGPPPYDLILAVLFLLVGVLLIALAVTSVARNVLLILLVAGAPLAFICLLVPDLHSYAISWRRLFLTTVFTQAVQVLILRLALMLMLQDHSIVQAVHGLVALVFVLKVPGAMHAGGKIESKLAMWARHGEHALEKGFEHATGMTHTRARAHPAAD